MPTQQEIADHLGISQQAVSSQMRPLSIDWRNASMTEVRLAYLNHLRAQAAGHVSSTGDDLVAERVKTEQVDRQLKELKLAELRRDLINVAELEPALQRMFTAFRVEVLSLPDKIKTDLDALHGIDVDLEILNDHCRHTLQQLAEYNPGDPGAVDAPVPGTATAGADDDDGVGTSAATLESESQREARPLQP